jgi:hypothetical protein
MTIKALYPNIAPSLSLDFANTKALDPRITFARASTARFYDGKTVVKAEENLLLQSRALATSPWGALRAVLTNNADTAPDGTTTATSITQASGQTTTGQSQQNTSVVAATHTMSVFAKPNGKNFLRFAETFSDGTTRATWFNVQAGTVGTTNASHTATITASTNGFFRCTITFTVNAARTGTFIVGVADTDGSGTVVDSGGILAWGSQLEQRSAVTAYTPTTTQPITNYVPVLQSAANNVARFDHNPITGESLGLLIEEQRTNLIVHSGAVGDVTKSWGSANCTAALNAVVAPDGTLSGTEITSTSAAGEVRPRQDNRTISAGTDIAFSCFVKLPPSSGLTVPRVRFFILTTVGGANQFSGNQVEYDFLSNTFTSVGLAIKSHGAVPVGNGWIRVFGVVDGATNTATSTNLYLNMAEGATNRAPVGTKLFYWGAQLEAGAFPTSYIPTVASQVTRSADAASMTGANFSSWYRADEGTMYAEGLTIGTSSANCLATLSSGAFANRVELRQRSDSNRLRLLVSTYGGTDQADVQSAVGSYPPGVFAKSAAGYATDDIALALNGTIAGTDTVAIISPLIDRMFIGASATGGTGHLNGPLRKLAFYPKRLANAEIVALTQN